MHPSHSTVQDGPALWGNLFARRVAPHASQRRAMQRDDGADVPSANLDVLDLTHDAIFKSNMGGVIEYWNRTAERIYGWKAQEAIGRVSHRLLKTKYPVPFDCIEAQLLHTGCWEGELIQARKDGTRLIVASRWTLQRDAGSIPVAIVETNSDITGRRHAETEKARLAERLRRAEKLEAIGCFASGIAHDFSNGLSGIVAYGEMLFDEALEGTPPRRYAQNVLTAATRGREGSRRARTWRPGTGRGPGC